MERLYRYSAAEAKRNDEIEAWRNSQGENIRCKEFLDKQVSEKFDGYRLPSECAELTVKEFGFDRTMWVIANSIKLREGDGRIHRENREWANSFYIPKSDSNYSFSLRSHSCIVDGLAAQVQRMYAELNLFDGRHIQQCDEPQDYTDKLLVLRAEVLKEEYRSPENQLFYATGGFGCSPSASGRKVFGEFLSDGEQTSFDRHDFMGIISPEHIPEWTQERLTQITEARNEQKNSPKLNM